MVRKSLSEKMTFQLRLKRLEGGYQAKSRGRNTTGGENICVRDRKELDMLEDMKEGQMSRRQ